jgi:Fe-S-cluster containining protein
VYLDPEEVEDLAEFLEVSPAAFRRRYTFVDEDGWTQLRTAEQRCVFLEPHGGRCRVYAARPTQCRTFPFWRGLIREGRWTGEARALCEGVGRGPLHSIEYAQARMLEMDESAED